MPGKKLWTWGAGPSGRIWENILTEGGGPYFEPQAGAFSDNQPDYHWLGPGEVKRAQDVWYPVRGIRGFKKATADFALNAEVARGKAFAGVYATAVRDALAITLEDARNGQQLLATTARVSPDRPWTAEVDARGDVTTFDLRLRVRDASGQLLAELVPPRQHEVPIPAIAKPRPAPAELPPDQLYAAGEWLDRFRRRAEALAYYEEALRRDPNDAKVHVELGDIALGETRYADALAHFDKALAQDAEDARANFGRASALVALGRAADAEPAYVRAGHAPELLVAAERGQARLAFARGDVRGALAHVLAAEGQGGELFADLPALRAAAHRLLGEHEPALAAAERALELDPMHFMAGREKCLALAALGQPAEKWVAVWRGYMRDSVQNQIELAAAYVEAGLSPDAEAVLADAASHAPAAFDSSPFSTQKASPMLDYLRGYLALRRNDPASARLWYVRGAEKPLAYVNPHRALEAGALEAAVREDVSDSHSRHLLGNVLYALGRREEALASWRVAAQLAPDLALAWRNIGMAEHQLHGDERAAAAAYRHALAADDSDPRVLLELDQTLERLRTPLAERMSLLDAHRAVVERRDDLSLRWVDLKLRTGNEGELGAVRSVLLTRHFHTWEGVYGIHHAFIEVNQRLGDIALARGDLRTALARYQQSFDYPKNLEVAPRTPDLRAPLNWSVANAYIVSGRRDEALPALTAVLNERYAQPQLGSYYQALALRALAKPVDAARVLRQLEERARALIAAGAGDARSGRDTAVGEYLLSLVLAANGDNKGSAAARARAEERDPQPARAALTAAQVEFAGAHQ
jgi:tetratricopeptide (TPR) repeat protein